MQELTLSTYKRYLIIWYNPNKNIYYYKYVNGFYQDYYVGFVNQYDHVVVLVIKLIYFKERQPLRKRIKRKLISFLEKNL